MPLYRFGTILGVGTKLARRAAFANLRVGLVFPVSVPVGRTVWQGLKLRAEDAIVVFVIHILPPFVPALHGLGTFVGGGQHPAVLEYFLADMRCFVRRIRYHRFHFRESPGHFVIYVVERHAVMYISRRYHRFQHKSVAVADRVRFIRKLPFVAPLYEQSAVRVGHALRYFALFRLFLPPRLLLFRGVVPLLFRRRGGLPIIKRLFPVRFPVRVHLVHQFFRVPLRRCRYLRFYLFLRVGVGLDMRPIHVYHFRRQVSCLRYFLQDPCKYRIYRFCCEAVPEVVTHRGEMRCIFPQRVSQKPPVRHVHIHFLCRSP